MADEGTGAVGTAAEGATNAPSGTSTESGGDGSAASGSEDTPTYSILVDGIEEQVSFDDLLKGHMRERDYTRKSQANAEEKRQLAEERQRLVQFQSLADALENDPARTIRSLAEALGVSDAVATKAVTASASADPDDPLAGVIARLDRMAQQTAAREQKETDARQAADRRTAALKQIDTEMAALHELYGDFVNSELAEYAVKNGLQNLSVAYKSMQYERSQEKIVADKNKATEAKRKAQVVDGGRSSTKSSTVAGAGKPKTLRESLEAARLEHAK